MGERATSDDRSGEPARRLRERWELTPMQACVAGLLASGMTQREAADSLGITRQAVSYHHRRALAKAHELAAGD